MTLKKLYKLEKSRNQNNSFAKRKILLLLHLCKVFIFLLCHLQFFLYFFFTLGSSEKGFWNKRLLNVWKMGGFKICLSFFFKVESFWGRIGSSHEIQAKESWSATASYGENRDLLGFLLLEIYDMKDNFHFIGSFIF